MEKMTYSIDEVAQLLGISKSKTYNLVRNNEIPHLKLGGRVVVPVTHFNIWLTDSIKGRS